MVVYDKVINFEKKNFTRESIVVKEQDDMVSGQVFLKIQLIRNEKQALLDQK